MDWGFLESGVENKYLRDEIVYQYPIYYYLAIMGDILLRFAWGLEFYLSHYVIKSTIVIEIVSTTFKSLEVFRSVAHYVITKSTMIIDVSYGTSFDWKTNI